MAARVAMILKFGHCNSGVSNVKAVLLVAAMVFLHAGLSGQPNVTSAKQGFSMRLMFKNVGTFGRKAYPSPDPPSDSIGLEYPISQAIEHIFGGGLWIGGLLDTSSSRTMPPVRLVSVTYEGWAGPLYEFWPGTSPADTIWKIYGRNAPEPPGWSAYWGGALPFRPLSDNDMHCMYRDDNQVVSGHIPMHLKIIQSSYVWNDPYAEAVHIVEYRIINTGTKIIDSSYVGFFLEGDVGPINVPQYWARNYSAYIPGMHTAYVHNPIDLGSTPVGLSLVSSPVPFDSLRFTFQWFPGVQTPPSDPGKYALLSSGVIRPDEYPSLSDTRFVLAFGPFAIRPSTSPDPDTLLFAVAIVSGQNVAQMSLHATRARELYLSGGVIPSVRSVRSMIPEGFSLAQNYPNPFNPNTTIEFSLPRGGHTVVTIHDMLGQKIDTIVDEELAPGTYRTVWEGGTRASGVYYYRLRVGDYGATKRMILLR